jgi:pyruvate-formate lyase-activating enzyme
MANLDRALDAFVRGDPDSDSLPYSLFIEASNGCNLQCPLCPTGAGTLKRPAQNMDVGEYRALIDKVADDIFEVHFAFFGEPLFNPHLSSMVRIAHDRGLTTRLMTNGTLVSPRRARSLIHAGLDRVTISFDGLDQHTYEQYRVGGQFHRVLQALRAFRSAREEAGSEGPWLEAQVLAMRHTESILGHAESELLSYGADEVKIKATSLELVQIDADRAWELLPVDEGLRYYDRGEEGQPVMRHASAADTFSACPAMYLEPGVVMSSGHTALCCRDPDGEHGYGAAFTEGFAAAWNGEALRRLRERFGDPAQRPDICRDCPIITLESFRLEPNTGESCQRHS